MFTILYNVDIFKRNSTQVIFRFVFKLKHSEIHLFKFKFNLVKQVRKTRSVHVVLIEFLNLCRRQG